MNACRSSLQSWPTRLFAFPSKLLLLLIQSISMLTSFSCKAFRCLRWPLLADRAGRSRDQRRRYSGNQEGAAAHLQQSRNRDQRARGLPGLQRLGGGQQRVGGARAHLRLREPPRRHPLAARRRQRCGRAGAESDGTGNTLNHACHHYFDMMSNTACTAAVYAWPPRKPCPEAQISALR
jgi:hypothetical protein